MRPSQTLVGLAILAGACARLAIEDKYPLLNFENIQVRDTANVTFTQIEDMNEKLSPLLESLSTTPYFSVYRVDLSEDSCPFEDYSGICGNRACAIEPLDEEIPEFYQSKYLGKLRKDSVSSQAPDGSVEDCAPEEESIFAYPSRVAKSHDYCYPEDEDIASAGVWVDLRDNIERFTGYAGPHAHKVWRAVYQENCFGYTGDDDYKSHSLDHSEVAISDAESTLAALFKGGSKHDRHARQELGGEEGREALNRESECLEQRLFYRLLSGMHASISTHLSYDYLDPETKQWGSNLDLFNERVGSHPDRLNNLYFNYVLVSRAVGKLRGYLNQLSFSSTCPTVDEEVRIKLALLGGYIERAPRGLQETKIFTSEEGQLFKEEFRNRVRNVNALMSCVGCERCRLWGKIQTAGYGTALKVLFELPEKPEDDLEAAADILSEFRRSELVALVQTFARLSHSLSAIRHFRSEMEDKLIDKTSFSYQWSIAMEELKTALYFILRSYLEFPKNVWNLFLAYATIYWNKFIGREATYTWVNTYHSEL